MSLFQVFRSVKDLYKRQGLPAVINVSESTGLCIRIPSPSSLPNPTGETIGASQVLRFLQTSRCLVFDTSKNPVLLSLHGNTHKPLSRAKHTEARSMSSVSAQTGLRNPWSLLGTRQKMGQKAAPCVKGQSAFALDAAVSRITLVRHLRPQLCTHGFQGVGWQLRLRVA